MKRSVSFGSVLAALAAVTLVAAPAKAVTVDNTSLIAPGVYYGSGNQGTNDHFTVDTENGVELGLTAIQRNVGDTITPVGNIYNVQLGSSCPNGSNCSTRAWWNVNFSVNMAGSAYDVGNTLATLTIYDVMKGTTATGNPATAFSDNAAYNGTTTREGSNPTPPLSPVDVGYQNSENIVFFPTLSANFNNNDTYLISLLLQNSTGTTDIASVNIVVNAGTGATPLPAALPLFGSALAGLGLLSRKRKQKKAIA